MVAIRAVPGVADRQHFAPVLVDHLHESPFKTTLPLLASGRNTNWHDTHYRLGSSQLDESSCPIPPRKSCTSRYLSGPCDRHCLHQCTPYTSYGKRRAMTLVGSGTLAHIFERLCRS